MLFAQFFFFIFTLDIYCNCKLLQWRFAYISFNLNIQLSNLCPPHDQLRIDAPGWWCVGFIGINPGGGAMGDHSPRRLACLLQKYLLCNDRCLWQVFFLFIYFKSDFRNSIFKPWRFMKSNQSSNLWSLWKLCRSYF